MRQDRKNSAWSTGLWPRIKSSGPPTSHTREQGSFPRHAEDASSSSLGATPARSSTVARAPSSAVIAVVITPAAAGNSGEQASPDDATQS